MCNLSEEKKPDFEWRKYMYMVHCTIFYPMKTHIIYECSLQTGAMLKRVKQFFWKYLHLFKFFIFHWFAIRIIYVFVNVLIKKFQNLLSRGKAPRLQPNTSLFKTFGLATWTWINLHQGPADEFVCQQISLCPKRISF